MRLAAVACSGLTLQGALLTPPLLRQQTGAVAVPCPLPSSPPRYPPSVSCGGEEDVCRSQAPPFLPDTTTPQDLALTTYELPLGSHPITCKHCHPRRIHFGGGRPGSIQLLRHKKGYTIHPTHPRGQGKAQLLPSSPRPPQREPKTLSGPTSLAHSRHLTPAHSGKKTSLPCSWLWSDGSKPPSS